MRKNEDKKSSNQNLIYSVLIGAAFGFILVIILFAVFSAFIAAGKASESLMPYLTALAAVLGALTGAVIAVRNYKGKLVIVGLSVGCVMFIVTFIFGLLAGGANVTGSMTTVLLVSFLAGGITGSFLSLRRKSRKHT